MKYILVLILSGLGFNSSGQQLNQFTFPQLDLDVMNLWLAAHNRHQPTQLDELYTVAASDWMLVRADVAAKRLLHFDAESFVVTQDKLLYQMDEAVQLKDVELLEKLAYEFLAGFREVRLYFTNDLYAIDELFTTFDLYQELHHAVDDLLLDLYDWKEFVQLYDVFKAQFDRFCTIADPGFGDEDDVLFKLMTQRVRDCASDLESAIETAQQGNFIAPCDDTHDALLDLIGLYAQPAQAPQ